MGVVKNKPSFLTAFSALPARHLLGKKERGRESFPKQLGTGYLHGIERHFWNKSKRSQKGVGSHSQSNSVAASTRSAVRGRPSGRSVDCRPNRSAVVFCQPSLPNGVPR